MPSVEVWVKLAAYVACMGVALELAHKLYWNLQKTVYGADVSYNTRSVMSIMFASLPLIASFVITAGFCRFVDNTSVASLGLMRGPSYITDVFSGAAIAFTCVSIMFFVGCSLGWFHIRPSLLGANKDSVPAFCGGIADFFVGAVFEELAIRGYVFFVLMQAFGGQVAIVGSAVLFAVLHLIKHPKIPIWFTVNAVLFGMLTAQCRLVTGALWLPIGLHFGWNLATNQIFGLPFAGRTYEDGLVTCTVEGPQWITGGYFSPDAGLLGTLTLAIATIAVTAVAPIC